MPDFRVGFDRKRRFHCILVKRRTEAIGGIAKVLFFSAKRAIT